MRVEKMRGGWPFAYTPNGYSVETLREGIDVMDAIGHALLVAGSMSWEILWALVLGFALSAVVQAVVRKSTIVQFLGDDPPTRSEHRSKSILAFAISYKNFRTALQRIAADEGVETATPKQLQFVRLDEHE